MLIKTMDKSEQCVRGAAAALLSGVEIKRLIMAAKQAFECQVKAGMTDEEFGDWRKAALWDAISRRSFKAVTQAEFGRALGHFRALAGQEGEGRTPWQKTNAKIVERESSSEGDRRRALFCLRKKCVELQDAFGGLEQAESYSLALLRKIHKLPQGQEWIKASPKQLWQVMFTMVNRAKAKTRQERV